MSPELRSKAHLANLIKDFINIRVPEDCSNVFSRYRPIHLERAKVVVLVKPDQNNISVNAVCSTPIKNDPVCEYCKLRKGIGFNIDKTI